MALNSTTLPISTFVGYGVATAVSTLASPVTSDVTFSALTGVETVNKKSLTSGGLITSLTVNYVGTANVTATALDLFSSIDNGVTKRIVKSVTMNAGSISATAALQPVDFGYSIDAPLELAAGELLYVATRVAISGGSRVFRFEGAAH
jgi:hypothetical protein